MPDRRTDLPDPRQSPRYAGLCTFARYPMLDHVPTDRRPIDWAVYGVPFDSGVTYRPGTRMGPRAIRDASQYVKNYSIAHGVDVPGVLSLADAGDAPVNPFSCEQNLSRVREFAESLPDPAHTRLLALGGDHSIAYANIMATWQRRGAPEGGLAVVHFDSHLDTVDQTLGERWSHASPIIRAVEAGAIDPARMISIGIKGPLNTEHDLSYARDHGVTIVTAEHARLEGTTTLDRFLDRIVRDPVYVTFDIDCVDPAYAPGTGTPSIGGFSSPEVLALIRRLRGIDLVGADVVEVLPDRDVADNTSLLAAHVAYELLSLDAARRAAPDTHAPQHTGGVTRA